MGGGAHGAWLLQQSGHRVRERQNPGDTLHLPGDRSPMVLKTMLPKASSKQAGSIASGKAVLAVGPGAVLGYTVGGPANCPAQRGLPALLLAEMVVSC